MGGVEEEYWGCWKRRLMLRRAKKQVNLAFIIR